MRIVLFGQKWLAAEVLKAITALPGVDVAAVCPDTETPDVLRRTAFELGIPSYTDMDALPPVRHGGCGTLPAVCPHRRPQPVRAWRSGLSPLAPSPSQGAGRRQMDNGHA